jgi:hypothetical protein
MTWAIVALLFGCALLALIPALVLSKKLSWPMRAVSFIALTPPALGALGFGVIHIWMNTRIQPAAMHEVLAHGVQYDRRVESNPSRIVWHVATIDLNAPGVQFMVTPGDPARALPFSAKTTTDFAKEQFAAVAISGDLYSPKFGMNPLEPGAVDGDALAARGFSASRGVVFGKPSATPNAPTLYISEANAVTFGANSGSNYNAISGDCMLLTADGAGKAVKANLASCTEPARKLSRAAIGYSEAKHALYLVAVDGDQASFSEGVTAPA